MTSYCSRCLGKKKGKLNMEQGKTIYELEIVVKGYIEDNWG